MGKTNEPGVLLESDRFFNTPSTIAGKLFYYITRCGHYFCTSDYDFRDDCDIAQLPSHRNSTVYYVISGSVYIENASTHATVLPGQVALIDCTLPHRFHALEKSETLWMHIEGCNTKEYFGFIRSMYAHRLAFTPP